MPTEFGDLFEAPGMDLWACLGGITDRSVRVWMRSRENARFPVIMRSGESVLAQTTIETDSNHDGVAFADLELDSPLPDTPFRIELAGMTRDGRLAPELGTPQAFSFVFGSCNQPLIRRQQKAEPSPASRIYQPLVRTALRESASFSLLVGDQAYADGIQGLSVPEWARANPGLSDAALVAAYRQVYRAYFGDQNFERLLSHMPSYLIWDDHEIFDSWGSHENIGELDRRLFRSASQVYLEYQHTHNPGGAFDTPAPYHYHFWYGNVGFFVLDLRSEREYNAGTLMSDAQWRSLEEFLAHAGERGVPTIFVVATIPLVHFSSTLVRLLDSLPARKASLMRERWDSDAFLDQRQRLLSLLFGWQKENPERKVLVLSGDVHAAAAFRAQENGGSGVISQWTSSALSTPTGLAHTLANPLGTAFVNLGDRKCRSTLVGLEPANNFGLVKVQPTQDCKSHNVSLAIFKYDGRADSLSLSFRDDA